LEPNGGKINRDILEHNGVENFELTLLLPTKVWSVHGLSFLPAVTLDDDDGAGKTKDISCAVFLSSLELLDSEEVSGGGNENFI